jgi:hypothetical protein
MKFNLLLLLLTTLTAVALSQQISGLKKIYSSPTNLFWALENSSVILDPQGVNWTIDSRDKGSFITIGDKAVQYNGPDSPLIIEYYDESPTQRWLIGNETDLICSSQQHDMCATAISAIRGWIVIASFIDPDNPLQKWTLKDVYNSFKRKFAGHV